MAAAVYSDVSALVSVNTGVDETSVAPVIDVVVAMKYVPAAPAVVDADASMFIVG